MPNDSRDEMPYILKGGAGVVSSKTNSKYILPAMQRPEPTKEFFNATDSNKKFHNNDYLYGTSGKKAMEITPAYDRPKDITIIPSFDRPKDVKLNSRAMRLEKGSKAYRKSLDYTSG